MKRGWPAGLGQRKRSYNVAQELEQQRWEGSRWPVRSNWESNNLRQQCFPIGRRELVESWGPGVDAGPCAGEGFSPNWGAQSDWVHGTGWVDSHPQWGPREDWRHSSNYRLMGSGGSNDMDFNPNWGPQANWVLGWGLKPRSGWGNRGDQDHGQGGWYSGDDYHGQWDWYSGDEYKSWNSDRQPGFTQRKSVRPTFGTGGHGQEQYLHNSASPEMLKQQLETLDRLQTSMSQFKNSELKGKPKTSWEKDNILPKRLQNTSHHSKLDRNKLFRGLKAAGKSIKESFQEQVAKVKNLVKPKSKEKHQSFSEVLSNEGVEVGLTLDRYLIEAAEIEKVQREKEENLEEDLLLWEEGWGGDFRLKTAGEEEEEDLGSPNWEDVKEVRKLTKFLKRDPFPPGYHRQG